jgi:hypothetical protein
MGDLVRINRADPPTVTTPVPDRRVPNAIFFSDNPWEIPSLRLDGQAEYLDAPVTQWGAIGRAQLMHGTYHFYTEDYRFNAVWDKPGQVVNTGCVGVVEPNFSCYDQTPRAVVIGLIFKKRWLARFWQSRGLGVWVDLNVSPKYYKLNLVGVPRGWRSYATRGYNGRAESILVELDMARRHAGAEDVRFWVYGGGREVKLLCRDHGLTWIEESTTERKRARRRTAAGVQLPLMRTGGGDG